MGYTQNSCEDTVASLILPGLVLEGGIVVRVHRGWVDILNFGVVGGTVLTAVGLR